MAATYRLLADHVVNIGGGSQLLAGSIVTEGVDLPMGFIPSAMCDPQNSEAIQKVWNAGPQMMGLVRQVWTNIYIAPPVIFWTRVSNVPGQSSRWQLTGQGAALGVKDYNGGTNLI